MNPFEILMANGGTILIVFCVVFVIAMIRSMF